MGSLAIARRELLRDVGMNVTLASLFVAATLEIAGDAAIRAGLLRAKWPFVVAGAALLVVYGLVVNANRTIDFGRLMGAYIAVFFIVSQIVGVVAFGERPSVRILLGGALIVAGGLCIQLGSE
jgi:drug/metabolite transporter superfamily protein YnfA